MQSLALLDGLSSFGSCLPWPFLDAEHLWLPDWLTLPGVLLGFICAVIQTRIDYGMTSWLPPPPTLAHELVNSALHRFYPPRRRPPNPPDPLALQTNPPP
jgi:hypothetical protein